MDLDAILATMPFAVQVGVELDSATPDEVVGHLEWSRDRTTLDGAMHGGAVMTLADSVGAVCAFLNLPEGASTSTVSSSTVFTRGLREGALTARATPLHSGRSTVSVVTELRDDASKLVAQVTQTQAVLTPK
ncbi:PaaI family thioesterase [Rhodococcus sp. NPDC058521]|uniref:PaaI family thioesterase n=1 Tax=Rhodococcus sp. NPDC058521 TaxID=3346536 RepID=UPI0036659BAF